MAEIVARFLKYSFVLGATVLAGYGLMKATAPGEEIRKVTEKYLGLYA